MRSVVYCATRNLYPRLVVAINSLLANNNIDNVYCFLEDSELHTLDRFKQVHVIDATQYKHYFNEHSPNYNSSFTYMSLMRIVLSKILQESKVLYLDVDTIVCANIEELFDIKLSRFGVYAVEDIAYRGNKKEYFNSGVMLMDLDNIRLHKYDDKMLELINSNRVYQFPDQDVFNEVVTHFPLPSRYNQFCNYKYDSNPSIIHYAGYKEWWKQEVPRNKYYRDYKVL